jgi:hypothetical protein
MLKRILCFTRDTVAALQSREERWRSSWDLSQQERSFVAAVLAHRRGSLLHREDDLQPIPPGVLLLPRLAGGLGWRVVWDARGWLAGWLALAGLRQCSLLGWVWVLGGKLGCSWC